MREKYVDMFFLDDFVLCLRLLVFMIFENFLICYCYLKYDKGNLFSKNFGILVNDW